MTILRKGLIERSVTIDQITGGVSHRLYLDGGIFGDWGKFRLDDIGLEMVMSMSAFTAFAPTIRTRPELA